MKTNIFNHIKKQISVIAGALILCCSLPGCYEEPHLNPSLALNNDVITLNAKGGTSRILIFADGRWNVKLDEDVNWLHLKSNSGNEDGEVLVDFDPNLGESGLDIDLKPARMAKLIVLSNNKVDTLTIQQQGCVPRIYMPDVESIALSRAGKNRVKLESNIDFTLISKAIIYPENGDQDWISNLTYEDNNLWMDLKENSKSMKRQAKIALSYTDVIGKKTTDTLLVSQLKPTGPITATKKEFDDVRSMVNPGSTIPCMSDIYIEGVVVSDKNNRNLAPYKNIPNTIYLQSMDGKQAFQLETLNPSYNNYNFGDIVKIALGYTMITKNKNPEYIKISGLTIDNMLYKEDYMAPIKPREVYMKDLTDRDMFTYVKLKDVEIAVPFGNFSNQNNGYIPKYCSTYPIGIRDINGDFMYMMSNSGQVYDGLINNTTGVEYQRTNLPKGSGSITGIIVHEEISNYGGDQGRYSIRQLKREDIALAPERENSFSSVLAEWSKFATPTDGNKLASETGVGTLSHSDCIFKNGAPTIGYIGSVEDYDGLSYKGLTSDGGFGCSNWWPKDKNRGSWWLIEVPTKNVSNRLSLQILTNSESSANNSASGPRNFAVEWSSDGTNWNEVARYQVQELVIWGATQTNQVPGYKTYNFNLPIQASGLEKLSIRLRVTDKQSCYIKGGEFNNDKICRLGHVSLKFNK